MEGGGEADLGVDASVGGQVGSALGSHPVAGLSGLHDPDGVVEGLQVEAKVPPVGASPEPGGQLGRIGGGQVPVAGQVGQLNDGGGP